MGKVKTFTKIDEFKKKVAIYEKLGLDERDHLIISLLQKDPGISQEQIAKQVKLSQPSVGARIKKLQQKGVLYTVNGVNFKIVDLFLAKVDVKATDTTAIMKEISDCPFFVNGLVMSGNYNLCLFFVATDLRNLEGIVNHHLRGNPKVMDLELNIVIEMAKNLVLPLNADYDKMRQSCDFGCQKSLTS